MSSPLVFLSVLFVYNPAWRGKTEMDFWVYDGDFWERVATIVRPGSIKIRQIKLIFSIE